MSPTDHTPDWIDISPQVELEEEEDHEPILGDQGELEIPPFGTFEDQLVFRRIWQTWMDRNSPIAASDSSDPGDDDIPDISDRESNTERSAISSSSGDFSPITASDVSDLSDSPRSPDSPPDFSNREIRYRERSGTETETEIDTEISTEIDDDPFNDAMSPISSGELEYSPSHSEASSNDDLPPSAFEPEIEIKEEDIEIDFEAINDPLEPPDIKLEHVGSMQVVQNPPDEDHDHLLIVETPESPDSEHNDHDQRDHIVPLIPLEDQEENHEAAWVLIPPGAQEELDHNVIPPLGNQDDNDVIFLDAVDPEVMEIEDEDFLARIPVALDVVPPLVHGPNDDVNDIIILDEIIVLREIEVILLDESEDDSVEQEGMEVDDVLIIQIDGLFDLFSDMSINRVDG